MHKVLITTSGIGSRLGEFTKYTNKTLIRVGEKPALSHIVEQYPVDTNFVITIGHFGDHVKEFLEIAYPNRKFTFVEVDKYEGTGSSLLYSMSKAEQYLRCPFIFHTSDTIVKEMIPRPGDNWIMGVKSVDNSSYSSFDVFDGAVKKMHHKGELNSDYAHIGLIGIQDYELFWKETNNQLLTKNFIKELSDVDVLKIIVNKLYFHFIECKTWNDVGNVDQLNKTRKNFNDNSFHVLDKLGESIFKVEGNVIKFFADKQVCLNRATRPRYMNYTTPVVTGSNAHFYKYLYVQGHLFANIANKNNFESLLNWTLDNLWLYPAKSLAPDQISNRSFFDICFEFYFTKTKKRVNDFLEKRNIKDKVEIINGEEIESVNNLLKDVDFSFLCSSKPTSFHGDFILDNIIKKGGGGCYGFKLIDWRQDFGGELTRGDIYYDLAKLAHNLVVNHGIINNNLFSVKAEEGEIFLNIHRLQTLVDCEKVLFKWLGHNGYSISKVKVLRSIIWLNMASLHHHPFDLFLYYYGRYTLSQTLKEMKENGL